jgi:hypothetical protein
MIRIHIPGLFASDLSGGETRVGDTQIIDDGKNFEVIDGYCGKGLNRLINALKTRGIKSPYLHITHAHYDHDYGILQIINDSYFSPRGLYCYDPNSLNGGFASNEIKSDAEYLRKVINAAKAKKIPVYYVEHGDEIRHGEIIIKVFRKQPSYQGTSEDPHGWSFTNDGSLCYWFPELSYFTSGDGPERIYDCCKAWGIKPKFFKIPHHGNNCTMSQANGLRNGGALYCWDNDYSTSITDFLQYGRGRCIQAGIKYFDIHGDINVVFHIGKGVIYKDGRVYSYSCAYKGVLTLKKPDLAIVKAVLKGSAGTNDARTTYLLNKVYRPGEVQTEINELYRLIKG